jgi:hypothetical protein
LENIFVGQYDKVISIFHVLEEAMELILILVVLFLVFGGGGYWGYRRWR